MSWRVSLEVEGQVVELPEPHHLAGGAEAALNITYNYGGHFRRVFGGRGLWDLAGLRANQLIALLDTAIEELGTDRAPDYWQPTPGNAGAALSDLRELAKRSPPSSVLAVWTAPAVWPERPIVGVSRRG